MRVDARKRNREAWASGGAFIPPKTKQLLLQLGIMAMVLGSPSPDPMLAEVSPTTAKTSVRIIEGPSIERADPDFAIIRWTTNTPGGSLEHFGVVRYGTDPEDLSQTAMSHIRLNPDHSSTVFRVRMDGLKPRTVYYYRVDSMEPNGTSDGVQSPVNYFATASDLQQPQSDGRRESSKK
jgi:purple acid phosphatase-like protein